MVDILSSSYDNARVIIPDVKGVLEPPAGMYADLIDLDRRVDRRAAADIYTDAIWTYQFISQGEFVHVGPRMEPLNPVLAINDDGKTRPTVNFMDAEAITGYFGVISGARAWLDQMQQHGVENLPEDCNDLWLPPNAELASHIFQLGGKVEYTFWDGKLFHIVVYENCEIVSGPTQVSPYSGSTTSNF